MLADEDKFAGLFLKKYDDDTFASLFDKLREKAEVYLENPCPSYEDDDALRITAASEISSRIITLAFLYKTTGESKYLNGAEAEMDNAASFADWNAKKHFLDTAAIARGMALGIDWLYDDINVTYNGENLREKSKKALADFALYPALREYKEHYCDTDWSRIGSNWNFVCNGGVLFAAAALMDDNVYKDDACNAASFALKSFETALKNFSDDGAWYEGANYGEYAVSYYIPAVCALSDRTGNDFGYLSADNIWAFSDFAIHMSGSNEVFNFGDGGEALLESPELWLRSQKDGNMMYAAYRLKQLEKSTAHVNVYDLLWYDANASLFNIDEVQKDMLFQSINTASFHGDYFGSESSFAALHSDRNDVTHSHLDCGSFVYDAEGVRFASDMGQDNYNLYNYWQTSSKIEKNRWCYYRMRAEGHNTLVINPSLKPDQTVDAHCTIDRFASKTDYGFCVADITDAYRDNTYSVKRGLRFSREDNSCIIRDEIDLKTESDIFWYMHTAANVQISADGKSAVLTRWGKRVWMGITEGNGVIECEAAENTNGLNPDLWEENIANGLKQANNSFYRRIRIKLHAPKGSTAIEIYMAPLKKSENAPGNVSAPAELSAWR